MAAHTKRNQQQSQQTANFTKDQNGQNANLFLSLDQNFDRWVTTWPPLICAARYCSHLL